MGSILSVLTLVFSLSLNGAVQEIEMAFLRGEAGLLRPYFPAESYIHISLPEPISFSDHVSDQQAYFLFQRIFSGFKTIQFFIDRQPLLRPQKTVIFKANWSFSGRDDDTQHLYHIFFYLVSGRNPGPRGRPGLWKIMEIRVEKS